MQYLIAESINSDVGNTQCNDVSSFILNVKSHGLAPDSIFGVILKLLKNVVHCLTSMVY